MPLRSSLVTFVSLLILQTFVQKVRMKSYIKLLELMKYNDKKYNGTVRSNNLYHKTIEKALSKNYSFHEFYG
jgi:predicted Zn-dependent protease